MDVPSKGRVEPEDSSRRRDSPRVMIWAEIGTGDGRLQVIDVMQVGR